MKKKILFSLLMFGLTMQHLIASNGPQVPPPVGRPNEPTIPSCGGLPLIPMEVNSDDAWIQAACKGSVYYLKSNPISDVNSQGSAGRGSNSALAQASKTGQVAVVQYLIDTFPNLNFETLDNAGYNPLIDAVINSHADVFKLLLPKSNVLHKDNSNGTALIWAAKVGNTDIVNQILADARVTPDYINAVDVVTEITYDRAPPHEKHYQQKPGKTALEYAKEKKYTDIVNALTAKGAQ